MKNQLNEVKRMQQLAGILKEEVELSVVGGNTGVKLNMRKVYNMLKSLNFNPQIREGNRLFIKTIEIGVVDDDGYDYGSLKISKNGELFGDDLWGYDIKSEDEILPAIEMYKKDQKDYRNKYKNEKSIKRS